MNKYTLRKTGPDLYGKIALTGSKSIANRALVIRALCPDHFEIHRLADAKDTRLLNALLQSTDEVRDAGAAGTTFRFLTAYLALQPGTQVLTGTERMKQRPIGVLVEALRQLGARIEYVEQTGYPPLRIGAASSLGTNNRIQISAGTSSQYISALLMIAPALPNGLELKLEGKVVSRPYIEMTLALMRYFGVEHSWDDALIKIAPQTYLARPFTVEADWSAASYYYALAAFADQVDFFLEGLFTDSVQGDAVLAPMMEAFGIETDFQKEGIHLSRRKGVLPRVFSYDFLRCPDLAQTLAVICTGLGVEGQFTGLETLRIKETDRIAALQNELSKVKADLREMTPETAPDATKAYFHTIGKATIEDTPSFATYEDHRMAMAFAPLAQFGQIAVEEPEVVVKSYPDFWKDMKKVGFEIDE